ncbi:UNVERIFIED_CONTAM: hypothetical protein K2H54_007936 [Gekko kuhli]
MRRIESRSPTLQGTVPITALQEGQKTGLGPTLLEEPCQPAAPAHQALDRLPAVAPPITEPSTAGRATGGDSGAGRTKRLVGPGSDRDGGCAGPTGCRSAHWPRQRWGCWPVQQPAPRKPYPRDAPSGTVGGDGAAVQACEQARPSTGHPPQTAAEEATAGALGWLQGNECSLEPPSTPPTHLTF